MFDMKHFSIILTLHN